jgi:hypothetical protein
VPLTTELLLTQINAPSDVGPNSLIQTSHVGKVRKRTCSTPGCGYAVRCTKEYVWQVSNLKQVHTHTFPPEVYQHSQTTTLQDALKDMRKKGRQLPLLIKEAIDVHVMTGGGDMKPQLIFQALKQWPSFSRCIYFTHPELGRSMVSKMRNYKNNNRTRNPPPELLTTDRWLCVGFWPIHCQQQ